MARIPVPPAPAAHDLRNQNEYRRLVDRMIQQLRVRLQAAEAAVDA
jgi:hypothetical protein